ncbi:hypothetical protein C0J52_17991 [Blattella germanica]|nr:hypothetical protein C0J52_17991 [Blattella germanica]
MPTPGFTFSLFHIHNRHSHHITHTHTQTTIYTHSSSYPHTYTMTKYLVQKTGVIGCGDQRSTDHTTLR